MNHLAPRRWRWPVTDVDSDCHPLDAIAQDFADRFRRGEHPSISDYAQQHPEHASELRELLPSIAMMEKLRQRKELSRPEEMGPLAIAQLGDYHIIREIGRGGMGVVYQARQESLGREVAVKVLSKHSLLDPGKRQRFEREAMAAARLHHTNIVP